MPVFNNTDSSSRDGITMTVLLILSEAGHHEHLLRSIARNYSSEQTVILLFYVFPELIKGVEVPAYQIMRAVEGGQATLCEAYQELQNLGFNHVRCLPVEVTEPEKYLKIILKSEKVQEAFGNKLKASLKSALEDAQVRLRDGVGCKRT